VPGGRPSGDYLPRHRTVAEDRGFPEINLCIKPHWVSDPTLGGIGELRIAKEARRGPAGNPPTFGGIY
jgi:hypothetical protein